MPPAKKQPGPDTQPKLSRGRRFGGRNRPNARGGRGGRPKREPAPEPPDESVNTRGEHTVSHDTWGQVNPSGWGAEDNSGWPQANDDWAMEAYTGAKIEAWIQQVEATDDIRPPSATSDAGGTHPITATSDIADPPTQRADPQLHQWALNFLNSTAVPADRKRRALQFLNQSPQQQFQTIYTLLQELRHL
ncbi:hypothetical protein FS749_015224 [Ceratobasidium sp. UAMH 11750]|nr:hypothetical protein FS749_015224 [Ceratobasidium sp. UAMH 11750]